jgi:hypothetical protein
VLSWVCTKNGLPILHKVSTISSLRGIPTILAEITSPDLLNCASVNGLEIEKLGIDASDNGELQPACSRSIVPVYAPARLGQLSFQIEDVTRPRRAQRRQKLAFLVKLSPSVLLS